MQKSHGNQSQGEDQLWKNHPKPLSQQYHCHWVDDKEDTKSFRASEATGEILEAAEEQSFHRSLSNCVVR